MENKGLKIFIHASTWFAPVLVPFIIFLVSSDREIKSLSLQAVIFHFVIGVLIAISVFFSWVLIGIPFLIIFGLIALITPIVGIVRAIKGRPFQYPIVGSWLK
ncbi:hypothetical protein CN326_06270 [Bacillus sp. AFS018417]|uniref:DUF4870 domain-containing protein n=1 Tax=unclassified Bacillus (in: firmicutes) TaxID=185979 RepID=UPI000BF4C650|nr:MULTISPECIES: DUF4870 domain-containing protein [unclassified Bacillus (in: firmicutes)]MCP1123681.1 DUF4870 domain-containing protein [Bacillus sp. 3103sda1]PEZ08137.1 hypothetical protein CN326_06270 [Bacillus sp. AFS018417]